MAENKIVGSLVLRTIDIEPTRFNPTNNSDPAVNNDFGICDARGSFVTWKNVNIRQCLGGLYRKYNKFNLKMTSVQMRYNQFTAIEQSQVVVYISGLPFSSYNTRLNVENKGALGCVSFRMPNTAGGGVTSSFTSGLVSFNKPLQDNLNISIQLKSSRGTNFNGYGEGMVEYIGHYTIVCDIYGIDEPYILSRYNMVENKSVGSLVLRTIDI